MSHRNADIRKAIRQAGLYLYEVAEVFGQQDSNFCRTLRRELDPATKARIYSIIAELSKNKKAS